MKEKTQNQTHTYVVTLFLTKVKLQGGKKILSSINGTGVLTSNCNMLKKKYGTKCQNQSIIDFRRQHRKTISWHQNRQVS